MSKAQCIRHLDRAIFELRNMRQSVRMNQIKRAVNQEANLIRALGNTLLCINELEAAVTQCEKRTQRKKAVAKIVAMRSDKGECIRLINLAILRLQEAKVLLLQNRFEDTETAIFSILSGRILRCLNRMR